MLDESGIVRARTPSSNSVRQMSLGWRLNCASPQKRWSTSALQNALALSVNQFVFAQRQFNSTLLRNFLAFHRWVTNLREANHPQSQAIFRSRKIDRKKMKLTT